MWSDRETEHDCLGFTSYVNVLGDICTLTSLAPLTLGIFGSWGSGKTSLMRMLKSRIEAKDGQAGVKTLWFNAWRYEGREEAQSALIHAILARLSEDKSFLDDAKDVLGRLTKGASVLKLAKFIGKTAVTLTPDLGGFIECFKEESREIAETMEQFEKDFDEFLKRMKVTHIVVFIDDLDRCSSAKVIETFETIKLFLNTPRCTFVIGADAAKIEDAVGQVYKVEDHQRRKDFLEKIVQVPFNIPAQDLRDITCYVGMLVIGQYLPDTSLRELLDAREKFCGFQGSIKDAIGQWLTDRGVLFGDRVTAVRDELNAVLPYVEVLAGGLRGNPRQIKRFLNIISLRHRLASANGLDVQPDLVIKLGVLEYVWDEFFNAIVDTVDPATGHSALIEEMLRVATTEDGKESESELVRKSLSKAGLVDFLKGVPTITGDVDLRPYLFLAQTSLSRGRPTGLVPVDEKATSLAGLIASEDPLRTKTAARQAAAQEPAVIATVVRMLLADLPKATETIAQTHILNGLTTICQLHRDQFPPVLKALASFDTGKKDAVALAASSLVSAAVRAGQDVPKGLQERFLGESKFAAALAPSGKRPTSSSSPRR